MNVSWTYHFINFTIHIKQTTMLYALNSYRYVCLLFLKTTKRKNKKKLQKLYSWTLSNTGVSWANCLLSEKSLYNLNNSLHKWSPNFQLTLEQHGFELHRSTELQSIEKKIYAKMDLGSSNLYCLRINSISSSFASIVSHEKTIHVIIVVLYVVCIWFDALKSFLLFPAIKLLGAIHFKCVPLPKSLLMFLVSWNFGNI